MTDLSVAERATARRYSPRAQDSRPLPPHLAKVVRRHRWRKPALIALAVLVVAAVLVGLVLLIAAGFGVATSLVHSVQDHPKDWAIVAAVVIGSCWLGTISRSLR